MPPGGIHLVTGVALSRYVLPRLPRVVPQRHSATFRASVVLGSILPDFDLFLAAPAVALTYDKTWVDVLHRTASHSLLLMALVAALCIVFGGRRSVSGSGRPGSKAIPESSAAQCDSRKSVQRLRRPSTSSITTYASSHADDDCAEEVSSPCSDDTFIWKKLVAVAGGGERHSERVASVLGALTGCMLHSLLDMFYIVPVALFWPHPMMFAFPIGPSKNEMLPQQFKLASCLDFLSDVLYFVPMIYACWRYGLHSNIWPKLAVFWTLQVAVVFWFLYSPLYSEDYHWEEFVFWLHCPWGSLFMVGLNFSPMLLSDAIRILTTPPDFLISDAPSAKGTSSGPRMRLHGLASLPPLLKRRLAKRHPRRLFEAIAAAAAERTLPSHEATWPRAASSASDSTPADASNASADFADAPCGADSKARELFTPWRRKAPEASPARSIRRRRSVSRESLRAGRLSSDTAVMTPSQSMESLCDSAMSSGACWGAAAAHEARGGAADQLGAAVPFQWAEAKWTGGKPAKNPLTVGGSWLRRRRARAAAAAPAS